VGVEQDVFVAVAVFDFAQRVARQNPQAGLFAQLAVEGLQGRLARFALAAGELPQPALMTVRPAQCDEGFVPVVAHHGDHHVDWRGIGLGLGVCHGGPGRFPSMRDGSDGPWRQDPAQAPSSGIPH